MGVMLVAIFTLVAAYVLTKVVTHYIWWRKATAPIWPIMLDKARLLTGTVHNYPGPSHVGCQWRRSRVSKQPKAIGVFQPLMTPTVQLHHPDTVRAILKSAEPKPSEQMSLYKAIIPWLGYGLITASGNKWARNRRLLTNAFHFDVLKGYTSKYNGAVDDLITKLDKCSDQGTSFEAFSFIRLFTLDVLLRCAMSLESGCQKSGSHPYPKKIEEIIELLLRNINTGLAFFGVLFRLTADGRKFYEACDFVHQFADEVIQKRKKAIEQDPGALKNKKPDFLDILLTAKDADGKGLSEVEIRSEVDTFMFAGHDTTASALSWALHTFAKYPEHQSKVQADLDKLFEGKETSYMTNDDLKSPYMDYLNLCIKESLRLNTPVNGIGRILTKPTTIDGQTFQPFTRIGISLDNLHRNPIVWEDVEQFKPERFTAENMSKMDAFAYCPFSAGPRNCIGQNFALHEIRVTLARLLHRYAFTFAEGEALPKDGIVLDAEGGINLKVSRRG